MPRIAVGVPVFNAEPFIDDCLTSLAEQTFADFEVVIYDNASTDRTGDICDAFASRDKRFKYIRQPTNKGATGNFLDALYNADAPLFLWRAHDDLSSPNFLEATHRVFAQRPKTRLAVGQVEKVKKAGAKRRVVPAPNLNSGPEPIRLARSLLGSEASWFYGLWHRETLIRDFGVVWELYPYGWGSDHLTLLRALVENEVSADNAATFVQRFVGAARDSTPMAGAEMQKLRRLFTDAAYKVLERAELTRTQRASLALIMPAYASKRVHSGFRIVKALLRDVYTGQAVGTSR